MGEFTGTIIALIALGIVFLYRAKKQNERVQRLVERGETGSAYVTELKRDNNKRSSFKHSVAYTFTAQNGQTYTNRNIVTHSEFGTYAERQRIEIVYDPDDPKNSMLKTIVDEARHDLGLAGTE